MLFCAETTFLSVQVHSDDDDHEELLPGGSNPDLILAIARLAMLRIYRHRKAHQAAMSAQTSPPASARPILATIVPYLHYQAFIAQMMTILEAYQTQLDSFGFKMQIFRGDGGASGGMDWTSLLADRPEEVQAQSLSRGIDLVIEGRCVVLVTVRLCSQLTKRLQTRRLQTNGLDSRIAFVSDHALPARHDPRLARPRPAADVFDAGFALGCPQHFA